MLEGVAEDVKRVAKKVVSDGRDSMTQENQTCELAEVSDIISKRKIQFKK